MNFLSPTWPSITSLKFLPPPPSAEEGGEPAPLSHLWIFRRMDINFVSTTNAGMVVRLGNVLEPKYQDGSPLSKLPTTVPISVGRRVRHLRGISEATSARTVAKPLGIINEFMGLATPAGAIWTRLVLVFSFSTGFLSRSHSFSLASGYPFCPLSSGARKARSAMIVAGAFSSCLQRGTDSDEAIRSPQT